MKITQRISYWLDVPTSDPDDARRRKLLNIILSGFIVLAILMLVFTTWLWFTTPRAQWMRDVSNMFWATLSLLVSSILLFVLNRYVRGWSASALFLFVMTVAITFVDTPENLIAGRSLFLFTLPIFLASMLMSAWTAFAAAGLSIVILYILIIRMSGDPISLIPTYFTLAFIALLAWLSGRSIETSLRDLRTLNLELDKRVEDRTRELAAALSRELAEAGKNQAILDGIADGVMVFDPDGIAIVANPSLSNLLTISPRALIGQTMNEFSELSFLTPADQKELLNLLQSPGKNNVRITVHEKTLSVNAADVISGLDHKIGTVAVFRDFTREAEIEQMKNAFVGMVSHELRTPLNAVMAYAEMLQEAVYGPLNPKQDSAAGRIRANSKRLLDLVSDLLDQASLEAGKMKIQPEEFKVADLVDAIQSVMTKPAADKRLEFHFKVEPGMPQVVYNDMGRLQQILINLINNAIKFTEKGRITARIFPVDEEHWAFDVTDTGPGIPANAIPYIFDAFRQVAGITTRQHGGAGLGLNIVKRLVELMRGEIKVSSILGQGTTFNVILPISANPEGGAKE